MIVFMPPSPYRRESDRRLFYMLKFTISYQTAVCRLGSEASSHIKRCSRQPQNVKLPTFSFRLGNGCLLFMAVRDRLKQQREARLHRAVRRLSGLCLVGSWQTSTNMTDWLLNVETTEKVQRRWGTAERRKQTKGSLQYKLCMCIACWQSSVYTSICVHVCVFVWPQAVRVTICVKPQAS